MAYYLDFVQLRYILLPFSVSVLVLSKVYHKISFYFKMVQNFKLFDLAMLKVEKVNITDIYLKHSNVFHFPGFSCTRLSAQSASRTHRQRRSGQKFTKIFWNFTSKLLKDFTKRYLRSRAGNPYLRGRISTVDLLVLAAFKTEIMIDISYLNNEVKCTEPFISISFPCPRYENWGGGGHGVFAVLGCTTVVTFG